MKRIYALFIAVCLVLALTACTAAPGSFPWGLYTEAPAATEAGEAPEATSAPELTDEPAGYVGNRDFCMEIANNSSMPLDIDFDSLADTIEVKADTEASGDIALKVSITRGADPEKPCEYEVSYCYDWQVFVCDCDPTDSRMEVIVCFVQDSEDYTSAAIRVNAEGSGFDLFEDGYAVMINEEHPFTSEKGFYAECECDVLGTRFLGAQVTVDGSGFTPETEFDFAPSNEWYGDMTLIADLPVRSCDENGTPGDAVTVPAGETIIPRTTDCETYVIMELADGSLVRADIEVRTGEDAWGVFIGGVKQDEYFDIKYAD